MIWGYITYYSLGYACQIYDSNMTSVDYINILETTLKDSLEYYNLDLVKIYFQYDGNLKH
jgi:hypothetical protein